MVILRIYLKWGLLPPSRAAADFATRPEKWGFCGRRFCCYGSFVFVFVFVMS